jgi:aryl-alcohol dehydrogenase-like predicted oxidoreductase
MRSRDFGHYGSVSALTLGGGGIGNVWGAVERDERVATVRAAVDAGITKLDVAPTYGPGEAELVVGEALDGARPDGLLIATKVELPDDAQNGLVRRLAESVRASLERLRTDHIDLLLVHSQIQPDAGPTAPRLLSEGPFREVVRPALERLVAAGTIGGWGLTAVGVTRVVCEVIREAPRPAAVQCVANALDMSGDMWLFGDAARPDNAGIRACAVAAGVPVVGIRAVAAGALTDAVDRELEPQSPAARDFAAAAGFRRLAAERGESAAFLAHRYALSMPDVATVVLGVKNRAELEECLAAEAAGPLSADEMRTIEALAS